MRSNCCIIRKRVIKKAKNFFMTDFIKPFHFDKRPDCASFSVFPAPLLYGSVFDASCILRETTSCTDSEGSCLLYDRHALRLAFHGLTIGLRFISTTLYYVTYVLARRKLSLLTAQHETKETGMKALSANSLINGEHLNQTEITYMWCQQNCTP